MADIFVSYTSSDRDWAFWIGQQLEKLGHTAHVHEWEIAGGGDIFAWMEDHHDEASHVLCVVSEAYLKAPYSALERRAAQWAAVNKRPNFALPVFIEPCEAPTLLAVLRRCDLHGLTEDEARARLTAFMRPASKPTGPVSFPGKKTEKSDSAPLVSGPVAFPGNAYAVSNVPINVPLHFLGRDEDLASIEAALKRNQGRVAITVLHGLRGVGKTTLAAVFADRHRADYRATWWIKAETESTIRADLVGLGVRLGWVAADAAEEPAVAVVLDRLGAEGDGTLLVYDNASNAEGIRKYLPRGGAAQIIVTSNAPSWGAIAASIEIEVWPENVGANYLIARTRRNREGDVASALSEALEGLPLAHEQAAAYCERLGISLAEYLKRFATAPARLLNAEPDAPAEYHDRMTVAKTFGLAIDEAAKLHPRAEQLIVCAALLAPEPIPLSVFRGVWEAFGFQTPSLWRRTLRFLGLGARRASSAYGDIDEAVAALRAFALIDCETISDERDPSVTTDCIRLHRLVRQIAVGRPDGNAQQRAVRALIAGLAAVYPRKVQSDPNAWPLARRLDALALALVGGEANIPTGAEQNASYLLDRLASYRQTALAAYAEARLLFERALTICEKVLGPEDVGVGAILNNLAGLLELQGDFAGAKPLSERALAIVEKHFGSEHPVLATSLNNFASRLSAQGDLMGARLYYERGLDICEKVHGPNHPDTAVNLDNLGSLLRRQGDSLGARHYYERALAIFESSLDPHHPDTAISLQNLGTLLVDQNNVAVARPLFERALAIRDKILGSAHPSTQTSARCLANALDALSRQKEAKAVRKKFGIQS